MKIIGMMLLVAGMASFAFADFTTVPEIDPSSATTALALLSGAVLVVTGRRKK